ncbi:hypothetical protein [Burkholderia cepacia]|uniref:hypothetical protein n=1 Tax=Burkholderia cepacia TaxID=292 RepID=UPI002FE01919
MECSGVSAGDASYSVSRLPLPVRVSDVAWFYVRYDDEDGSETPGAAYVVHTYSGARKLIASARGRQPVLYLCLAKRVGGISLRRVVAVRDAPDTSLQVLELEDGRAVMLDLSKDGEGDFAYLEIDLPLCISQLEVIELVAPNARAVD